MMGELLRPFTFIALFGLLGTGDIHSMIILPLFSISLLALLIAAYRKGILNPKRPLALLMIIYTIMTAITPFVQPRYLLLCLCLVCAGIIHERRIQEYARKRLPNRSFGRPRWQECRVS